MRSHARRNVTIHNSYLQERDGASTFQGGGDEGSPAVRDGNGRRVVFSFTQPATGLFYCNIYLCVGLRAECCNAKKKEKMQKQWDKTPRIPAEDCKRLHVVI